MTAAPFPTYRLIPSRFPPIGLFDTVSTPADLEAAMELAGWTNDRLLVERARRLPESEWVFGRANASVVMAAFLHVAPGGGRFNGPDLGAWYAAAALVTAIAEVAHHLRRETVARAVTGMERTYRCYGARLDGDYEDVRGRADLHASDSYQSSQAFGETLRARGADGIVFDSVRHKGGVNLAVYRPSLVRDVTQAAHFRIAVTAADKRVEVIRL